MKKKLPRGRKPSPKDLDDLPKGARAWFAAAEQRRRNAREAYEKFFERAKALPPIERAEAWLRHVADHPDNDGDLEAIIYLASRGYDCAKYISRTVEEWKLAEAEAISQYPSNKNAVGIHAKGDIENASPALRNFWMCHRSQEDAIESTMLRAVGWCGIGGFEPWWKGIARSANERVLRSGSGGLHDCFWLFNMCRSPYGVQLMPRVLDRCLDSLELCNAWQPFPWDFLDDKRGGPRVGRLDLIEHLYYAASFAFCCYALRRPDFQRSDTALAAVHSLQKHQLPEGGWGFWADRSDASIKVTATAVHALAAIRPEGYERNLDQAAAWLFSRQDPGGYWWESACPDPAYLTVLVLDALALARDGAAVTFRYHGSPRSLLRSGEMPDQRTFRFRVALSFPGEHRARVKIIADLLARAKGTDAILYDEWHRAEFARPNLDVYLQNLYHQESLLLVFFLCGEYAEKDWCGLEWRAGRDLLKRKCDDRLMFLRLDQADIPGLYSIDGYIDISELSEQQVAREILARLAMLTSGGPTTTEVDRAAFESSDNSVSGSQPKWEGVEWNGTYYAFAGPLLSMDDRDPVSFAPQLAEAFSERGVGVHLGNPELLSNHLEKGYHQVYATDKKSWRRPVTRGRQLLLAKPKIDTTKP